MSILEVHDVSIRYMTGDFKTIGLKEYVVRKLTGNYKVKEFWADKNITFNLEKGEMLGIIGSNGAGKSTLLKAVSGIMEPVEGYVVRRGKIAALLELASGFDGDLTVRENAYLRGAMLGYTRKFMDETYDQIIDFAELREFQDRPFKQLSSGMKSRLAFSIASMVKPEILILDEVLSVGDGAFRKKSEEKMKEIIGGGATTILVSHSLEQVRNLCTKVLWLEKGQQIAFGDTAILCSLYQQFLDKRITLPQAKQHWQQLHGHYDWLVVGAGFYGAAFAQAMSKQGKRCLVIDRRTALGGAAACENMNGVMVHLWGPHIFHTNNDALWKEVNAYTPFATYDGGFGEKYQGVPKAGYGAVVEKMLKGIPAVTGVSYMELLNAFPQIARNVLYTGSPDELLMNRLGRLEYTANRYEQEELAMEDFQGQAIVIQKQNTARCSRVIEYKHFTGAQSKKTVIAHEFPTDWVPGLERLHPVKDARNQNLYQQYMALVEEMTWQVLQAKAPTETAQFLTAEVQKKTRETVEKMQRETLEKLAHAVSNLHFAGRLGEYKEYSMAESILAARRLAKDLANI